MAKQKTRIDPLNDPEDEKEIDEEYVRRCKKNRYRNRDPRKQSLNNPHVMQTDDRKGKGL